MVPEAVESASETGISLAATAFASAMDGGIAVTGAVTTVMNEGLAAMEGQGEEDSPDSCCFQRRGTSTARCLQRSFCCRWSRDRGQAPEVSALYCTAPVVNEG